jgi:hypothetical protein
MLHYIYTIIDSYVFENFHDFLDWSCDLYKRTTISEDVFGVNSYIIPYEDILEDY